MGWFWADAASTPPRPLAPHPLPSSNAAPPVSYIWISFPEIMTDNYKSGCPMHKPGSTTPFPPRNLSQSSSADDSSCPIASPSNTTESSSSSTSQPSTLSKLNPLNYMPSNLSQSRSANQKIALPTSRTTSSIPRGDSETNWEYPSPQQMYNAMLRKGYDDTPEDAVESMVAVHNFLNEGAWAEIEGWEARFSKGLSHGWQACKRGEEGFQETAPQWKADSRPRLLRFMGRPEEMTPKARMISILGTVWPGKYR